MAVAHATGIPLRRAYATFSKKRLGYKPKVKNRPHRQGTVHLLPNASSLIRVADDEVVVTDGSWGYTPFKLSELEKIVREAKKLPVQAEFFVNSVKS